MIRRMLHIGSLGHLNALITTIYKRQKNYFSMLQTSLIMYLFRVQKVTLNQNIYRCMENDDERELFSTFPLTAQVFMQKKTETINHLRWRINMLESIMREREKNMKFDLALANARYLKEVGDLNLRRIIEDSERKISVQYLKKTYRSENRGKLPNRKSLWLLVFADEETARFEFPKLWALKCEGVAVGGIINDIFNFSSNVKHICKVDSVLIDASKLTRNEVLVAEALCKDFPIPFLICRIRDPSLILDEDDIDIIES